MEVFFVQAPSRATFLKFQQTCARSPAPLQYHGLKLRVEEFPPRTKAGFNHKDDIIATQLQIQGAIKACRTHTTTRLTRNSPQELDELIQTTPAIMCIAPRFKAFLGNYGDPPTPTPSTSTTWRPPPVPYA